MREQSSTRSNIPLPKEHGSWAMFVVPLIIGFAVAAQLAAYWPWRSILLIAAALGLFLIRFPIDTLIKTRRRPNTDRAWLIRWAIVYGLIAAVCGGWLIVINQLYWLIPLSMVGAALLVYHWWLVERRKEMSARGELAGIFGLALGAPLAYYASTGRLDGVALMLWIVNALYFGGTVFYIKLKVRQQPKEPAPDRISERLVKAKACLTYQSIVLTIVILLVAWHDVSVLALLAFVPMTLKVVYGATRWQDRKSLSLPRLGVIEMIHSALFAVLIIAAF
ncbi:MAG TPA: YwiC-like family protein [Anaerolineae bacterium]|nr:YwiC-like family protein [Anaerolineae bacterium]